MKQEVIEQIEKKKIIAILRGIAADRIGPVCKALLDGGVTVAEITFDQSDPSQFAQTAQAISTARQMVGDAMVIGAGTVLTAEQAKLAQQAGAAFFVTPNTKEEMIRFANAHDIATVIGAMTATECQQAHEWGADFVKLFPSETMGAAYLKALRAPLNHLRFIAVGSVDENNMKSYLQAGAVGVGIGSNLVSTKLAEEENYAEITRRARMFCAQTEGNQ